ncbi:MAG TPA: rRNA methyltransferase, partial [Cryomorphaceae bacterium]|nr:rRNA methyltransferase [Cryomorphaceae bacterium]
MSLVITSTANPKVKDIVQLLTKSRERKSRGVCIVEGSRDINRALACGWEPVELWQLDGSEVLLNRMAFPRFYLASPKVFGKIAYRNTTECVVAVFKVPEIGLNAQRYILEEAKCVLVLEGIEKPGNLGAALRTACAAGVDAVVLADAPLDPFSPNVIRNATGALFEMAIISATTEQIIPALKALGMSINVTYLNDNATSMFDVQWSQKCAIVLGEEAGGLTELWI